MKSKFNLIYEELMQNIEQFKKQNEQLDQTLNMLFSNLNSKRECHQEIPFNDFLLTIHCEAGDMEVKINKNNETLWIKSYPPTQEFITIAKQQLKEKIQDFCLF